MIALAIVALVAATLADVFSTRAAIEAGAVERNPLLRAAGPAWVWARVVLTALVVVVVAVTGLWWAGLLVAGAWLAVSAHNWRNARGLKK